MATTVVTKRVGHVIRFPSPADYIPILWDDQNELLWDDGDVMFWDVPTPSTVVTKRVVST